MALKDIISKIKATERTHKVTKAMEAVSAAKMRGTQAAALSGRSYARAALSILARLSGSVDFKGHPLMSERPVKSVALVIITSDKGLAGALNTGVIKAATAKLKLEPGVKIEVYAYGRKGEEYFARRNYAIVRSFHNKSDKIELAVMDAFTRDLSRAFIDGKHDRVYVAYSHFKSTFEQVPTVRTLLPLSITDVSALVRDIVPEKGKFSMQVEANDFSAPAYTVEPDDGNILSVLLPRLVAISLYHMLLESKASEHSARMVAMKNASDKSEEMSHALTRLYNKRRQAAITREVSEIVGGREALAE